MYRHFPARALAPVVAPKAAVKVDLPVRFLFGRVAVHFGIIKVLGEFELAEIELRLQLAQVLPRPLHRREGKDCGDLREHRLLLVRRRILGKEGVELRLVPLPRLLECRTVAGREQQAQKKVKPVHGVLVEGLDNCLIKFSRCCTPIPGDDIVGYITRGQGVSIHRTDCANYARREFKPEDIGRWINVSWADEIKESYATAITVVSRERNGLIMDIASIFNTLNTKVRTINARDTGDKSIVNITLETSGIDELRAVVNRISALPGVVEVKRNGGKR